MKLYIIRHGQSEADILNVHEGRADFPLTQLGRKQVKAMASTLTSMANISQIYSSPLKRASQSATIVAQAVGAPVLEMPELMEFNNGLLAGLTFEEAKVRYPMPISRPPHCEDYGMESMIAFRARAEVALSKIIHQTNDEDSIAIVCHGGMIQMMYRAFLNLPMDNTAVFLSGDAALHLWEIRDGKHLIGFANRCDWMLEE